MRTALVVDDHPGFRAQARRLLEHAGYQVLGEAADGASALAVASSECPDVVLLDIQLPDMTGFDVAVRLVEAADCSSDVVLVSSRSASAYGSLIDQCGARGFIWKGDLTIASLAAIVGA
jgi:DNA-binding NarL/FixJ family response regulator